MKLEQEHFLIVSFASQGHLNPARHLARRLVRTGGARVTISTGLSAHRKLFPSSADDEEVEEGLISYIPYSDGYCDGERKPSSDGEVSDFFSRLKLLGSKSLSLIVGSLADRGRPVTCIVYTILLSWAVDVARDFGVPSVPFWVQPAAVFAIFHRYFHGASDIVSAHRDDPSFPLEWPGLPPLRIRDLPSFLVHDTTNGNNSAVVLSRFEEMFRVIDQEAAAAAATTTAGKMKIKPMVLVNTFDSLEPDAVKSLEPQLKLMAVATIGDDRALGNDLFEDDSGGYMEWLDRKEDKSVVYVSFGSIAALSKRQLVEMRQGLEKSGKPYMWVVRNDAKEEQGVVELSGGGNGIIVQWCNQVRVLSHRSVGCFVTHCGWNSTVESVRCGVPTVLLPQ